MQQNTHPEFVGLDRLKAEHARQLAQFETWAENGQWQNFHHHHYDWWMFPIARASAKGFAYSVFEGDVAALKQDDAFMQNLRRGAELLALSWGWDLNRAAYIDNPAPSQRWQNWPIRLHKAATSLQLFGLNDAFASLQKYGQDLLRRGESGSSAHLVKAAR